MLQFRGRNITSESDLLKVKAQATDFIKPIKFEEKDRENLTDSVFELTKELIFNQADAYICLNCYKQEHKNGLEIYVYNRSITVEKAREVLNNNCNLSKKGISLDKDSGFLDRFNLKNDRKTGVEIYILKWA